MANRGGPFGAGLWKFLRELDRQNNRSWFEKNKSRYESEVREPALEFIRAMAPHVDVAATRWPGWNCVTPSPSSRISPASSNPGEKGNGGLTWYLPAIIRISGKLTPQARIPIRISPPAGVGAATSSRTSDSGGPYSLHSKAFIVADDNAIR